ncbi:MAG: ribonuclease Y [Patescibacteria group bacterium]
MTELLIAGITLALGIGVGYVGRRFIAGQKASSLEERVKLQTEEAKTEAKSILVDAKDKAVAILEEAKEQEKNRLQQIQRAEERLIRKEEDIERQGKEARQRDEALKAELDKIAGIRDEAVATREKTVHELARVAGLSAEEAKKELFQKTEETHRDDLIRTIQRLAKDREVELEKRAVDVITTALHRYARSHVADITTSVLTLPNEDLKGKIIGREGRNIRTLERLTGVEVIVDETPEAIILSSFDPLRREIAKAALEKLIKDGRIHPAKIEEKVKEAESELTKRMSQIGEESAHELGIYDLPKEITQLLGRLHFRTSYGQNVLIHSVEMAYISAIIAGELGANVEVAKKGALLHDIGKAISHEVEGTHVDLGRKILKKYGVDQAVIHAMESHHEEYPFATPESFIVTAADALSAARPGARRDTVENYLKRLEDLERIVNTFDGVKNSYALSAGREIRVFVVPEKVDDFAALQMAKNIAAKIQSEMKYPGEIKVNVIRELRSVEYAK